MDISPYGKARFTDPKHTKEFSRSGGFKGRATSPTYLMRRATEVFGPMGIGWGWSIVDDLYTPGAPVLTSDGVVLGNEIVLRLDDARASPTCPARQLQQHQMPRVA
jgi:hypothetical protein